MESKEDLKKRYLASSGGLCAQGGAVWLSVEFPGRGATWLQEVPLRNVRDLVRLALGSLLESRLSEPGRPVFPSPRLQYTGIESAC